MTDIVDVMKGVHAIDVENKGYCESVIADLELIVDNAENKTGIYSREQVLEMLKESISKSRKLLIYIQATCNSRDSVIKENVEMQIKLNKAESSSGSKQL